MNMVQQLRENLNNPYEGKVEVNEKPKRKAKSKPPKNDPIRKIMNTNKKVVNFKKV